MKKNIPTNLPLEELRILDLTTVVMGPFATQILGDLGAEVIKIEEPKGDMTRVVGPSRNKNMSSMFLGTNRNKKSITINLKNNIGKEALKRLIKTADIFIHNIRPQKIALLGFDPNSVLKINPKIIYAGLHGYGENGPYGGMPAYDDVIQGQSGLAGTFMEREKKPSLVPSVVADKSTALLASTSILASHIKKLKTGNGIYLEISMFEGMVANTMLEHHHGATFIPPIGREGYPRVLSPDRRPYKTLDGYICMLAYTNKQWNTFWSITKQDKYKNDVRFSTAAERAKNINVIYGIARKTLLNKTTKEWLAILKKAEIPSGAVNKLADLEKDPHLNDVSFFRTFNHPTEGKIKVPDTGIRIDNKALPIRIHQPTLGEHNSTIFNSLGFSSDEIKMITKGYD